MGFKPLTYKSAPGEEPHITPEDDAAIYESIVGTDGVFMVGERFKATVISNNKVRIGNGVLNVGGHMGRTTYGDYVDVTIENGVSEQNRNDLIIARFVIGDTDTYELDVKKGVSGKEAVDPELIQEDLYNGGKTREYPLYRVKIEGLSIVKVEQMFELRPTIPMINKNLSDILHEELEYNGLNLCTDIHPAISNSSAKGIVFFKRGKALNMTINIELKANVNQYATLLKLPVKFKPAINQLFAAGGTTYSINSANGAITPQQKIVSGAWIQISIEYQL